MINLRGYQWWQGGLVMLPALAAVLLALVVGTGWGTDGNRKVRMVLGLGGMALATWHLSVLDLYTSKYWLAAALAVWALGAGLAVGPVMLTVFEGLSQDEVMRSAGVFNIMRSLPTFIIGTTLITLWTQATDANFDWLRQKITYNRPIVAEATRQPERHFVGRGSGVVKSGAQAHATLGKWVHANSRAFALQTILQYLALATALGPGLILFVRVGGKDG
jgi:hypothetical protein